jgi:hypothetical protein
VRARSSYVFRRSSLYYIYIYIKSFFNGSSSKKFYVLLASLSYLLSSKILLATVLPSAVVRCNVYDYQFIRKVSNKLFNQIPLLSKFSSISPWILAACCIRLKFHFRYVLFRNAARVRNVTAPAETPAFSIHYFCKLAQDLSLYTCTLCLYSSLNFLNRKSRLTRSDTTPSQSQSVSASLSLTKPNSSRRRRSADL